MNVEQCRKTSSEALSAGSPSTTGGGPRASDHPDCTPRISFATAHACAIQLEQPWRLGLTSLSTTEYFSAQRIANIVAPPPFGPTKIANAQWLDPRERRPLGLAQAWSLAKANDNDNGQGDETFDLKNAFDMAKAEADGVRMGSPSPAPRPQRSRKDSEELATVRDSGRDLGQQLKTFDRNHQLTNGNGPLNGLFSRKNSIGPKVAETANTLVTRANDGGDASQPSGAGQDAHSRKESSESLLSMEDYHRFSPLPSIVPGRGDLNRSSSKTRPGLTPRKSYNTPSKTRPNFSPEKSFNWQLDADFTAGDLQISDSPRIKAAKTNGREANHGSPSSSSQGSDTPNGRRSDARLEQIRQAEIEAAGIEFPESDESYPKKTNRRLEEIRAREMEAASKRAVATSRLDEIRIKNSEARSESQSPELAKATNKDPSHRSSLSDLDTAKVNGAGGGEAIKDDPLTTSKGLDEKPSNRASDHDGMEKAETHKKLSRNDSYDLLRQLARATSASPSPPNTKTIEEPLWQEPIIRQEPEEKETATRPRFLRDDRRPRNLEAKGSRERPSVGFAGLSKNLSGDFLPEKRRILATSEADPIDRIEAEMKLFAPQDNYSEKGSVRAPSATSSDMGDEETPRPDRGIDPLSQPTPRVTGAYVDTPATVRVKTEDGVVPEKKPEAKGSLASRLLFGSRFGSRSRTSSKSESESKEPVIKQEESIKQENIKQEESDGQGRTGRAGSKSTARHSRAASRRRKPLINTAKIPTPSEDLRAILRQNRIDDSTLDDAEFDRLLAGTNMDHETLEKVVSETIQAVDEASGALNSTEREEELERQRIERMSKSLKTGLLGIRSAKQGIERLEGRVAQSEHQIAPTLAADLGKSDSWKSPTLKSQPSDGGINLSIPRLYRRKPDFGFTPLGLLSMILLAWYTLESAFCFLYVTDYECAPNYPCDWSPHEPYFPYAMPFMLDEWTTGGKGRELAWRVGEEIGDAAAEVTDWVTGNDFTKRDIMYMNAWERKRHWRRLRKHGLVKKWNEPPEYRDKIRSWKAAFQARERARETGDDWDYEMTLSEDETL
ncbi:uncharacterized protein PG998_002254 [Apiospora kogelbergensis]|uniref:uncharacterized protein n=1 Tax=Apiospora kogelbergensis TaxID=1337665 RepID=UPI00312D2A16